MNIIRNGGSDTYDMELFSGVDDNDGDADQGRCKEEDEEGHTAPKGGE